MNKQSLISILACVLFSACHFFENETEGIPVARVNDSYLYQHDIEKLVTEGTSREDSILRVTNYINQWATEQLLINGAQLNLPEVELEGFEELVRQYRSDLYTKAYMEALVKQNIDTSVTLAEAEETYNKSLKSFKLNEDLIKFRYINIVESNSDIPNITERFKRFNAEDKTVLDSLAIHFTTYSLNDSIWIKVNQVIDKIPTLSFENRSELLKKSNFIQLKDSLGLYLMHINDVLRRNEIAPIEYVMPTIKQIVINKRKLEFIKQLEKDITKDAIKNGQFEIYD